jgi:hypothetical protein
MTQHHPDPASTEIVDKHLAKTTANDHCGPVHAEDTYRTSHRHFRR